jgi:polysaccharide export outer membrane protein
MEDESFNGVYRVREAGDVILPRIGRVKIVDLTAKSAESAIRAVLEKSQLAKATVIVDRVSLSNESSAAGGPRAQIYLTGSVNRPGLHQMVIPDGGLGVYEAIMIGGGANRFGDERKVTIIRRSKGAARNQYTVDLTRIRSGQSKDVPIQDGDIIMVPERKFIL